MNKLKEKRIKRMKERQDAFQNEQLLKAQELLKWVITILENTKGNKQVTLFNTPSRKICIGYDEPTEKIFEESVLELMVTLNLEGYEMKFCYDQVTIEKK